MGWVVLGDGGRAAIVYWTSWAFLRIQHPASLRIELANYISGLVGIDPMRRYRTNSMMRLVAQSLGFMIAVLMQNQMGDLPRGTLVEGDLCIDHLGKEVGRRLGKHLRLGLAGSLHE